MSKRNIYMDMLNVIASFAVIVLHCTTSVFLNTGDYRWHWDVVLQACFLFAVPVFFMISGANLIGYRERYSTKEFFKRRFKRVLVTLVGYSALYYLLGCLAPQTFGQPTRSISIFAFLDGLFTNSICDVYWFLYAILVLYAITPLLSKIADDTKLFGYATALSVVTTVVIPLANRFAPDHSFFDLMQVSYLSGWIMYYLLGYYLVHIFSKHLHPLLGVVFGVFSVAVSVIMTIRTNMPHAVISGSFSEFDSFYLSASGFFTAVYSCCMLVLFKEGEPLFSRLGNAVKKVIAYVSSLSFGVYAVHMLIINTLDVYVQHSLEWDIRIRPFVVFAIALAISAFVQLVGACKRVVSRKLV